MNRITGESLSDKPNTKECLLRQVNSVSNSGPPSFEDRQLAWEASTLPLSYTRSNRIYFSPKISSCKEGVLALSENVTWLSALNEDGLFVPRPKVRAKIMKGLRESPQMQEPLKKCLN